MALGQALGLPNPRLLLARSIVTASERPAGMHSCSPACVRRVALLFEAQHLVVPVRSSAAWLVAAASPTAVEACWNLIPGFNDRWSALWDLRTLESRWGPRPFGRNDAAAWLAHSDAETQGGPLHRRRRGVDGREPVVRLKALEAEGWLLPAGGGGLQLSPVSLDAVMLLRLVLGAAHVPTEALNRLGRIRPPLR